MQTKGVKVYEVTGTEAPVSALLPNGVYLLKINVTGALYKIMLVR